MNGIFSHKLISYKAPRIGKHFLKIPWVKNIETMHLYLSPFSPRTGCAVSLISLLILSLPQPYLPPPTAVSCCLKPSTEYYSLLSALHMITSRVLYCKALAVGSQIRSCCVLAGQLTAVSQIEIHCQRFTPLYIST